MLFLIHYIISLVLNTHGVVPSLLIPRWWHPSQNLPQNLSQSLSLCLSLCLSPCAFIRWWRTILSRWARNARAIVSCEILCGKPCGRLCGSLPRNEWISEWTVNEIIMITMRWRSERNKKNKINIHVYIYIYICIYAHI